MLHFVKIRHDRVLNRFFELPQWPLRFTSGTDEVQVYAPQPEHIEGDHFTVRFAVSIKRAADPDPMRAAVEIALGVGRRIARQGGRFVTVLGGVEL